MIVVDFPMDVFELDCGCCKVNLFIIVIWSEDADIVIFHTCSEIENKITDISISTAFVW